VSQTPPGKDEQANGEQGTALSAGPVVELTNAAFAYEGVVALDHVSLCAYAGEAVALIGPNGSGKSTLLRGLLGLLPLADGSVKVFGHQRRPGITEGIGYLPQQESTEPNFPISLRQVVMMGRYRRIGFWRSARAIDRLAVNEALEMTGLTARASARFGALSGGQQQRGLLARALAAKPRLLLLDEPFNGLDQPNRAALLATLRELKMRGVTIVVTTHDLDLARDVCDKVLLLAGTQVAFGATNEVLTLENLQAAFGDVQVEIDEHRVVIPGHDH
jgi:manganese/iron transport system ATP-binding protein